MEAKFLYTVQEMLLRYGLKQTHSTSVEENKNPLNHKRIVYRSCLAPIAKKVNDMISAKKRVI